MDSTLSWSNKEAIIGGIPTRDVTGAFIYYIEHFNNNRPFILAGHSQGSDVLTHLLGGYLKKNPQVFKRMIAGLKIMFTGHFHATDNTELMSKPFNYNDTAAWHIAHCMGTSLMVHLAGDEETIS